MVFSLLCSSCCFCNICDEVQEWSLMREGGTLYFHPEPLMALFPPMPTLPVCFNRDSPSALLDHRKGGPRQTTYKHHRHHFVLYITCRSNSPRCVLCYHVLFPLHDLQTYPQRWQNQECILACCQLHSAGMEQKTLVGTVSTIQHDQEAHQARYYRHGIHTTMDRQTLGCVGCRVT
jgi:hypothetical protein